MRGNVADYGAATLREYAEVRRTREDTSGLDRAEPKSSKATTGKMKTHHD